MGTGAVGAGVGSEVALASHDLRSPARALALSVLMAGMGAQGCHQGGASPLWVLLLHLASCQLPTLGASPQLPPVSATSQQGQAAEGLAAQQAEAAEGLAAQMQLALACMWALLLGQAGEGTLSLAPPSGTDQQAGSPAHLRSGTPYAPPAVLELTAKVWLEIKDWRKRETWLPVCARARFSIPNFSHAVYKKTLQALSPLHSASALSYFLHMYLKQRFHARLQVLAQCLVAAKQGLQLAAQQAPDTAAVGMLQAGLLAGCVAVAAQCTLSAGRATVGEPTHATHAAHAVQMKQGPNSCTQLAITLADSLEASEACIAGLPDQAMQASPQLLAMRACLHGLMDLATLQPGWVGGVPACMYS